MIALLVVLVLCLPTACLITAEARYHRDLTPAEVAELDTGIAP